MRLRSWILLFGGMIFGMTLGVILLAAVLAGDIYDYHDDGEQFPPVDAIVCLAGGKGRIEAAGETWYRYWQRNPSKTPILYLSGTGHQSNWNLIRNRFKPEILRVIRPEYVLLERQSSNTDANARWFAHFAKERGWSSILLMTSPYHMKRANYIFEQVLKTLGQSVRIQKVTINPEDPAKDPFQAGSWRSNFVGFRVTLLEYFKWIYYRYFWSP